jgi:hypothetical protein
MHSKGRPPAARGEEKEQIRHLRFLSVSNKVSSQFDILGFWHCVASAAQAKHKQNHNHKDKAQAQHKHDLTA